MTPRSRRLALVLAPVLVIGTAVVGGLLWPPAGAEAPVSRTLLVTGFGAFGPYETNPAWESIRDLDGTRIAGYRVRTGRLDVVYDRAREQLDALIAELRPDAVVCLGVAPGEHIRLETVARNRDDDPHADNEGEVRRARPIRAGAPDLLPSRLPIEALHARLVAGGYPVRTSDDAGGYLCNHVFYALLADRPGRGPAGFVHVPALGGPWDLPRVRRAVREILEVVAGAPR